MRISKRRMSKGTKRKWRRGKEKSGEDEEKEGRDLLGIEEEEERG